MSVHTPGPWVADTTSLADSATVWTKAGWEQRGGGEQAPIALCADPYEPRSRSIEECRANAQLMAAAPDMLAALKRANEFITNGIELGFIRMPDASTPDAAHETPGIVRAAIAKAEGRS
jgi:hypothetical protein